MTACRAICSGTPGRPAYLHRGLERHRRLVGGSHFPRRIGADRTANYVNFRCDDNHATSIDIPTALHPQVQHTFWFDEQVLPRAYGFPMKMRMPTKLGFKNPNSSVRSR